MTDNSFFERPVLNSPYEYPDRHWELDEQGQPTQRVVEKRRPAEFITPIPKPRKRKGSADQQRMVFDEGVGLSTEEQQYDPTSIINNLRRQVNEWRSRPNPNDWQVTPETARLLQHWRHHKFSGIRPFFCQACSTSSTPTYSASPSTSPRSPWSRRRSRPARPSR